MSNPILIVGGGPAGLAAAHSLGSIGRSSILVEKEDKLGGAPILSGYAKLVPTGEWAKDAIGGMVKRVADDSSVQVQTGTTVTSFDGEPGNFNVELSNGDKHLRYIKSSVPFFHIMFPINAHRIVAIINMVAMSMSCLLLEILFLKYDKYMGTKIPINKYRITCGKNPTFIPKFLFSNEFTQLCFTLKVGLNSSREGIMSKFISP